MQNWLIHIGYASKVIRLITFITSVIRLVAIRFFRYLLCGKVRFYG
nr:MAG TPA: hypothetical protein [Caudoviricetes sp.]